MPATDEYLWFVDQALDGMAAIVASLGDGLACSRPDLPGANSPYAILTHCLGVLEYWGGAAVAGREIQRDRAAELTATGLVADLLDRVPLARSRLAADLADFEAGAPPEISRADRLDEPAGRTKSGVVLHIIEELAQHHGQMEITRDLLVAGG